MNNIHPRTRILGWDYDNDTLAQKPCSTDEEPGLYTGILEGHEVYYTRRADGSVCVLTWPEAEEIACELARQN